MIRKFARVFCRNINMSGMFYVLGLICLMASNVVSAGTLNAIELIDKYAANQDKMKSLIAKTEVIWIPSAEGTSDQEPQQLRSIAEFRYEDTGKDFKAYYCKTRFKLEINGTWVEEESGLHKYLWRDKLYHQYWRGPRLEVSKLYVSSDARFAGEEEIPYEGSGSFRGVLCGDIERIDSILRKSNSLSVRSDLDLVGSVECYVIDAVSRHGTYTIWLDPEHGYGIAKAIVRKGPEDLRWGRPRRDSVDNSIEVLQNVRFECVNGIWFPMEFEWLSTEESKDRTLSGCTQYKVTYLDANPDHNDLGSFRLDKLDIQDGTRVKIPEAPGIRYVWQNGKIVADIDEYVIEEIDKMSEEIMAEGQASSGLAAKKTKAVPNDLIGTANTQPKAQVDAIKARPEVVAESDPLSIVLVILIGFLTIGIIGWLVFRRIKA